MSMPSDSNEPERSSLRRIVTAIARPAPLRRHPEYAVIVTVLSFIVAIGALVRDFTGVTSADLPTFSSDSIVVDQADGYKAPWCTYISGSAPDRDDATLWIAIRDRDQGGDFFLEKATHVPGSEKWDQKRRLGDRIQAVGNTFEVYVFFVSNDVSNFMDSVHRTLDETGQGFHLDTLPPKVRAKLLVTMVRTSEEGEC